MRKVEMLRDCEVLEVGRVVQATPVEADEFNQVSGNSGQWLERVYHGEFQEVGGERLNWYEVHELSDEE